MSVRRSLVGMFVLSFVSSRPITRIKIPNDRYRKHSEVSQSRIIGVLTACSATSRAAAGGAFHPTMTVCEGHSVGVSAAAPLRLGSASEVREEEVAREVSVRSSFAQTP